MNPQAVATLLPLIIAHLSGLFLIKRATRGTSLLVPVNMAYLVILK